jgi:hypothetical protein
MSVSINYSGRFGNNITQYIFARIFSENNGLQLITNFNHINSPISFTDHITGAIIPGNQLIINDYSENGIWIFSKIKILYK